MPNKSKDPAIWSPVLKRIKERDVTYILVSEVGLNTEILKCKL